MTSMARRRRGNLRGALLPAFFAALILAMLALSTLRAAPDSEVPWDTRSAAPNGAKALRVWLAEQGYAVDQISGADFSIPDDAALMISFPGGRQWTDEDVSQLRAWVERGGGAVLVQRDDLALQQGFSEAGAWDATNPPEGVHQALALLPGASSQWASTTLSQTLSQDAASLSVPVTLAGNDQAAAAVMRLGDGWVWLLSAAHPLTNADLDDPNQVALATALLRGVEPGAKVYFDDYHAADAAAAVERTIATLQEWLFRTAPGRALLFALLLGGVFWLSAGQRLGPAIRSPEERRRREAAEYVRAIASLKQRAHTLDEVATLNRTRLKVALGRSERVDATLDDAEFVRQLLQTGVLSDAQATRLQKDLAALAQPASEQSVLAAAADGYALMQEVG